MASDSVGGAPQLHARRAPLPPLPPLATLDPLELLGRSHEEALSQLAGAFDVQVPALDVIVAAARRPATAASSVGRPGGNAAQRSTQPPPLTAVLRPTVFEFDLTADGTATPAAKPARAVPAGAPRPNAARASPSRSRAAPGARRAADAEDASGRATAAVHATTAELRSGIVPGALDRSSPAEPHSAQRTLPPQRRVSDAAAAGGADAGDGVQALQLDEELCRLKRAIAALKAAVELPTPSVAATPSSHRRLQAEDGAAASADAPPGDRAAAAATSARTSPGVTLADHLAHASRGESRVDDAGALEAAAARLQQRARQLREAAHVADSEYVLASAALDVRLACAATEYEDVCDDDARDALAAAAAADAADAAAAQAEELAAAMTAAAYAARTQRPPPPPPPLMLSSSASSATRQRDSSGGQPAGMEPPFFPREASRRTALSAADFGKRMRVQRARAAAAAPAEAPPRPFRAHPVPRSTREPRFERLMLDAALVREQRRMESMERLRASELPFSFYARDAQARVAAEQERAAERERLLEAVMRATRRTELAGAGHLRPGLERASTPLATRGRSAGASPRPQVRQRGASATRPRRSSTGHVLDGGNAPSSTSAAGAHPFADESSAREQRSKFAAMHAPMRTQSPAPSVARPRSAQPGYAASQHLPRFEQLAADCAVGPHASRAERDLAARAAQLRDDAAHARDGYMYDGDTSAAGRQYVEDWGA